MRCLPGTRKAKTPIIFQFLAGSKINGAFQNCIEAVALCREYMCMLRKLQDQFLRLLLPCNISAGRCD
nr:RepA leader peptide Tap [Serratia marcescens]